MKNYKLFTLVLSIFVLAATEVYAIGKRNASPWSQLAVLDNGKAIAVWANDYSARVFIHDSTTGKKVKEFKASACMYEGEKLASSGDGAVLLISTDSIHQCFDAIDFKTGEMMSSRGRDLDDGVDQYAASPDGKSWQTLNTFSRGRSDPRPDYSSFDEIQYIDDHKILANRCGYDDNCLLMGPHSGIGIYDLKKQKWTIYEIEGKTYMSNFSVNGGIALNWSKRTREGTPLNPILIFGDSLNNDSLRLIREIPNAGNFKFAAVSPEGSSFVTYADEVKIWKVSGGQPISTEIKKLAGLQYLPDGNIVVLSEDQKYISILQAKDGKVLRTVNLVR